MADDRSYRVQLRFDAGDQTFTATVPELGLSATADTRAEATARIEEALEARVRDAAEQGETLPAPIDLRDVDGQLQLKVSATLHRELLYLAETSGMAVEVLASEMLASAVAESDGRRGRRGPPPARAAAPRAPVDEDAQPSHNERPDDRGRRGGNRRREGYQPELENQANFMEHLRNLERGGGGGRGGRGRR
jgi:predicted RNase H-like HicB family nuclease